MLSKLFSQLIFVDFGEKTFLVFVNLDLERHDCSVL